MLNKEGFLAHFCEVGDLLTGEAVDISLPAPEVLRQVVLTNSLDWAGWEMGGQAVGAQLLGPGVLV